jgi:flagellar protein FlaG
VASTSASSLILFIAAVTIAAGVATTMVTSISDVSQSMDDQSVDVARAIDTDVEVISDPGSGAVYDGKGTVTLLVKNTGGRTIDADPDAVDVLVDGRYVPAANRSTEVVDGQRWEPGSVVRLTVEADLDPGSHRVSVVLDGDEEVFRITV